MTADPEFGQVYIARDTKYSDVMINRTDPDNDLVQIIDLDTGKHRPWITPEQLHANYTLEQQ